jgi:hypothetical protein
MPGAPFHGEQQKRTAGGVHTRFAEPPAELSWPPGGVPAAELMRAAAGELGGEWTPALLERARWAHVGGKAGAPPREAPYTPSRYSVKSASGR